MNRKNKFTQLAIVVFLMQMICSSVIAQSNEQGLIIYRSPSRHYTNNDFNIQLRKEGGEWQPLAGYYAINMNKGPYKGATLNSQTFAYFDSDFRNRIEVKVTKSKGTFESARVRPLSYGININKIGNSISFFLDRPRNISVEFDNDIRNNVFEDCLTSGCATGKRGEWGEAIITITPSHRPENETTEPYHKNIKIENNIFKTFDIPLVHARSVRGLVFSNNEIIRTYTYKPYTWQKSSFLLDGCREVVISGNKLADDYTTRAIEIEHMKKSDVKADKNQKFNLVVLNESSKPAYVDDWVKKN